MSVFTKISSINQLKNLLVETILNKTSKVTKVSDQSVLNGIIYGIAKVGQKAQKDIALVESHLFYETAVGDALDTIAQRNGLAARFGASGSSTFIRLIAQPGTTYSASNNIFQGQGVSFELQEDVVITSIGYAYVEVRSQNTGSRTNVPSLTINTLSNAPNGHLFVTNEYKCTGGRDIESDESLRRRIQNASNVIAESTLNKLTQICISFNSNILQVYSYGKNEQGQNILAVSTQNGAFLTDDELQNLLVNITPYLPISQYDGVSNTSINTTLVNVEYDYIDIDFRVELVRNIDSDQVRRDIQISISKYLDFRYWNNSNRIQWDDLLEIVKNTDGVNGVVDSLFIPRVDIEIDPTKLVKIRGFIMRDLDGNIIIDTAQVLGNVFYPNTVNQELITSIIR